MPRLSWTRHVASKAPQGGAGAIYRTRLGRDVSRLYGIMVQNRATVSIIRYGCEFLSL
ncbi:MAG TPA: hypothetical protein VGK99_07430 [Acidobacteriota bacterium]